MKQLYLLNGVKTTVRTQIKNGKLSIKYEGGIEAETVLPLNSLKVIDEYKNCVKVVAYNSSMMQLIVFFNTEEERRCLYREIEVSIKSE